MNTALPTALFILGPTASGKTALALALARHRPIEIISVDSALVYRGMDIGTAKPTAAERAVCPHHLIDIIEPIEAYSAAQFAQDAERLIHDIHGRGNLPVLVGGTMLYVKALLEPLTDLPVSDASTRARVAQAAREIGWAGMYERLQAIDPVTAARFLPTDAQRIGRALEVFELSGKPLSQWIAEDAGGHELSFSPLLTALIPQPRQVLHERINARFVQMLADGLLDEVRSLRARGDLSAALPSMRCVGYRQAWEYLDGAYDEATLVEKGQAATRQLAKRQMTWLRGMTETEVFNPLQEDVLARLLQRLDGYKNRGM